MVVNPLVGKILVNLLVEILDLEGLGSGRRPVKGPNHCKYLVSIVFRLRIFYFAILLTLVCILE